MVIAIQKRNKTFTVGFVLAEVQWSGAKGGNRVQEASTALMGYAYS